MARYGQNIFATGSQAYRDAWDDTQAIFDKAADRQAGQALAGGDRRKAMEVYGNAGRVDAVRTLQDDQSKADADTAKRRREVAETLIAASDELAKIPDINERYNALSHPIFQMLIPQEHLSQIKPEHLTDQGLAMFRKQAQDELQIVPGEGGSYAAVSKRTGQPVHTYTAPRTYKPDWRERTKSDGSTEWFDINAESGGGAPGPVQSAPQGRPAQSADDAVAALVQMGAKVTSGVRTPERNAAVGGQPNSYHLASRGGVARDLVPPAGMNMAQFHNVVRENLPPGWEAINEGDHIHIEPGSYQVAQSGGQMPSRPGTIRGDAPKPKVREVRMSPEEVAAAGYQPGSVVFRNPETGEETVKQGPGGGSGKITDGQRHTAALMYRVAGANERLNGLANRGIYKPQSPLETLFNVDKNGTVRLVARTENDRLFMQAAREWLAPILRRDTGAAVTDEELRNYMSQYIPAFEDPPSVLWNKAQARDTAMRALYGEASQAYDDQFGKPGRWRVLTDPMARPGYKPAARKSANPNSVTVDGVTMTVKPKTR